jgi:hypothetical protein
MNLAKQAHLHKVVGLTVATSVGTLLAATIVLNTVLDGSHGNVLSQTTSNVASQSARTANYNLIISSVTEGMTDTVTGNKRVTVKLNFQNLSKKTLQISPGLQMFMRGANGTQYNMTAKYLARRQVIGGPLPAGVRSDLSIDFDLPSAAIPAAFIYQPDAGSTPSVIKL